VNGLAEFDPWRGVRVTPELLDMAPPHNVALEKNVLGTLMVFWPELKTSTVTKRLDANDFHVETHGRLWGALAVGRKQRLRMNGKSLIGLSRRTGVHVADMAEMLYECKHPCHIEMDANRLRAFRVCRQRIMVAAELLRLAYLKNSWDDETATKWLRDARRLLREMGG